MSALSVQAVIRALFDRPVALGPSRTERIREVAYQEAQEKMARNVAALLPEGDRRAFMRAVTGHEVQP